MEFPKALLITAFGASMLFTTTTKADEYNRAEVYQAFYSYIMQNTSIDPKFQLDDFALSDLLVAMQQVSAPTVTNKEEIVRQQFEWWLARRGQNFLSDDDDGPGDGCVGGGSGSRDGDDDDCGGSDN
ncbi:hypothetical protein C7Y70_03575 [Pseudoalteromonas sp. KS88]|uniref:hypothetical protein n=1 Tax=Pseudoalteromonas sp. KS88 TaxID=2109918 RepID=UPI001081EC54|nr:hypothetical protein [Pseudoalteromonas sp. KS88]TGE84639.1 hypothetical protein C7Y70_03575 [Pseudoalteromonas sp. KS88]